MALQDVRSGTWLALFGAACLALRLTFSAAGSWKEPALLLGEAGTIACCLAPPQWLANASRTVVWVLHVISPQPGAAPS